MACEGLVGAEWGEEDGFGSVLPQRIMERESEHFPRRIPWPRPGSLKGLFLPKMAVLVPVHPYAEKEGLEAGGQAEKHDDEGDFRHLALKDPKVDQP